MFSRMTLHKPRKLAKQYYVLLRSIRVYTSSMKTCIGMTKHQIQSTTEDRGRAEPFALYPSCFITLQGGGLLANIVQCKDSIKLGGEYVGFHCVLLWV